MCHQLLRNLFRERRIKPTFDVDRLKFLVLTLVVCLELRALEFEVGLLGVRLRVDGHILTGSHRHRSRHEGGDPCD